MITINPSPKYLLYAGSTFTVEWYFDERGHMAAREYYDRLPNKERERLNYIVKYMADSPLGT